MNRRVLYKNTLLRNVVKKKKSVWVQRVFLTMTLVMLFFNFFSNGYAINKEFETGIDNTFSVIQSKAAPVNDNTELYKGLYVQLIENLQRNSKQYLTSIKDIEALGYLLYNINASVGNLYPLQFSKEAPVFDTLLTDVLNYTFTHRDVNTTKFFFNTTSNTIFVAETLNYYGLLDLSLLDITSRLGTNATNDTILTEFANKTLRDVFRQSLLLEFVDHPSAIAPTNEKYEPGLSHAIQLGILSLADVGLPDPGITYQDYLNGQKPTIEIQSLSSSQKNNILFKQAVPYNFILEFGSSTRFYLPFFDPPNFFHLR
jgi:hypothetical protein